MNITIKISTEEKQGENWILLGEESFDFFDRGRMPTKTEAKAIVEEEVFDPWNKHRRKDEAERRIKKVIDISVLINDQTDDREEWEDEDE